MKKGDGNGPGGRGDGPLTGRCHLQQVDLHILVVDAFQKKNFSLGLGGPFLSGDADVPVEQNGQGVGSSRGRAPALIRISIQVGSKLLWSILPATLNDPVSKNPSSASI